MKTYAAALLCFFTLSIPNAFAIGFDSEKDHCAQGEYKIENPESGAVQAGLFGLDDSAWAETGECLKFSIEELAHATADVSVMTWKGVTRIASDQKIPLQGNEIFHDEIMYESRQSHFGCHTAQWQLEWKGTVVSGTPSAPEKILVEAERVPSGTSGSGNSDGAYIKKTSVLIELMKSSASQSSFHMRYEIQAPGQTAEWAVGAITDYAGYLTLVAGGGKAPGPVENPNCPND